MRSENNEELQRIKLRCIEEGDCWIWTGATSCQGIPVGRREGKTGPMRRIVAEAMGIALNGRIVTCSCENKLCVAPAHIQPITRKKLQRRTGERIRGTVVSQERSRKIRETKQAAGRFKLSLELAREIRADPDSQRMKAKKYGVTQYAIGAVENHKIWKDHVNPWAQIISFGRSVNKMATS